MPTQIFENMLHDRITNVKPKIIAVVISSAIKILILLLAVSPPALAQQEQVQEEINREPGRELIAFHEESSSGPDDIAQSPAYTTVLSGPLPTGSYVVNSKVVISDTQDADPFPATVRCTIFNGNTVVDTYALQMGRSESGIDTRVFTLQGIASIRNDSAVLSLRCRKGSNDTTQISVNENPKLTAIRVWDIVLGGEEKAVSLANEDCLTFNPQDLRVRADADLFLITDGRSRMMLFRTREKAAEAIRIIRHYQFNSRCFAVRPDPGLSYFKVQGDIPSGGLEDEDCLRISNPQNLTIRESSPSLFQILDGQSVPYVAKSREEAQRIVEIVRHYDAGFTCYVERPDPGMIYLRR